MTVEKLVIFHDGENCSVGSDHVDGSKLYERVVRAVLASVAGDRVAAVTDIFRDLIITWTHVASHTQHAALMPHRATRRDLEHR
jgi:hypothetical protein